MPNNTAKDILIKHLTNMNREQELHLDAHKISNISEDIIQLFADIKKAVNEYQFLSLTSHDRIVWTPNYQHVIDDFKNRLLKIISPIGKISPEDKPNALWAGNDGMIAAKHFGHPTLNTFPAYLIDLVFYDELKAEFFANMSNDIKDMAVVCIYWALLSSIYAENINGEVNVYLSENIIHSISFFWNFELPILREMNPNGKIFLNVLKPTALLELKKLKNSSDEIKINNLLISEDNWKKLSMEEHLKLTTDNYRSSITYKRFELLAKHWKNKSKKQNQHESTLLRKEIKQIPKEKLIKYNTPDIVRYHFTNEDLEKLRDLYHSLPINSLVLDIYNFENENIDINIHKKFKHLITWDPELRFFIQPTPVYGDLDRLRTENLPHLKDSEYGVHLEVWTTYPHLLKNSYLEHFWFGSDFPQKKPHTTFKEIEDKENSYCVSILDLEQKHLPLLKSMKQEIYNNLKKYYIKRDDHVNIFFHFPYAPKTASLHLHVRVNQQLHPLELAKSISLDLVIEKLEQGKNINEIILEQQALSQGYIYSDEATMELPQKINSSITEKVSNKFRI